MTWAMPLNIKDPKHPVKKSMELGPRDRLSQAFIKETREKKDYPRAFWRCSTFRHTTFGKEKN